MTVARILAGKGRKVITIEAKSTLAQVCDVLAAHKIGAVVAADKHGRIEGIISERDIVRALAKDGPASLQTLAEQHMSRNVVTCEEHDTVNEVMTRMSAGRFRHVPVVRDARLIGIISIGDVVKLKIEMVEREAEEMRAYIASA